MLTRIGCIYMFIGCTTSLATSMRLLIPVGIAESGARASGLQVTSFPAQGTNGINECSPQRRQS